MTLAVKGLMMMMMIFKSRPDKKLSVCEARHKHKSVHLKVKTGARKEQYMFAAKHFCIF